MKKKVVEDPWMYEGYCHVDRFKKELAKITAYVQYMYGKN